MTKNIVFGDYSYPSKKEFVESCLQRLEGYSAGKRLGGAEFRFWEQLFTLHPTYKNMTTPHIKSITYGTKGGVGKQPFFLTDENGNKQYQDWMKTVEDATLSKEVELAFRNEVSSDTKSMVDFMLMINSVCAVSGKKLIVNEAHVAYGLGGTANFNQLVSMFLAVNGLQGKDIEISAGIEGVRDSVCLLSNRNLARDWVDYHGTADLTVICSEVKDDLTKRGIPT